MRPVFWWFLLSNFIWICISALVQLGDALKNKTAPTAYEWINFIGALVFCNLLAWLFLCVRSWGLAAGARARRAEIDSLDVKSVEVDGKPVEFSQSEIGGIVRTTTPIPINSQVVIKYETSEPMQRKPPKYRYDDSTCRDMPPYCDVCGVNLTTGSCSPYAHVGQRYEE